MSIKKLPFSESELKDIVSKYPTPFHIYDERGVCNFVTDFLDKFSWNEGFKEFYAIKACPNPHLMKLMHSMGLGIDCSSMAELVLAEKLGITGEEIMFTSNDTPDYEFKKAVELGAIINLDDISHIDFIDEVTGLPELVCFRYNPGELKSGNDIIGNPKESKYGFTREQLFEGYKILKEKGVKRFGIHTMVASNELGGEYFVETADIIFNTIKEISEELDIKFEFANLGGGVGVAYRPEESPVDLDAVSNGIKEKYEEIIVAGGLDPLKIYFELGRAVTGPYGYLVSSVLHIKNTYKSYVGLDSCMTNLMRPALYGAYHHITVVGKEDQPLECVYDVTGSLCENNDKFAIDRELPKVDAGDLVVIHDTGAHGHSMGFNYNGKLKSAELLFRKDRSVKLIRREETIEDHYATVDFVDAVNFK